MIGFAPAVALDLAVKWLKTSLEVSDFVATLMTWTKYIIATIDALLYVVFKLRMGWLFEREKLEKGLEKGSGVVARIDTRPRW